MRRVLSQNSSKMSVFIKFRKFPLGLFFSGIAIWWTMYSLCLLRHYLIASVDRFRTRRLFTATHKLRVMFKPEGSMTAEVRHIAYLKVHKTASSTLSNILLRFGDDRNLNFVLPKYRGFLFRNVISVNETVNAENIMPLSGNYDILCSHVVYNKTAWEGIMPSDTVYIASVREPFDQFVSVLQYFYPFYVMNISDENSMSKYLENPKMYELQDYGSFTNNRIAFEFGFPKSIFMNRNTTDISQQLRKLNRAFRLVVIFEYFDESLILLKRYLHWRLFDILYIEQNKNYRKDEPHRKNVVQSGDRENYKNWAVLDYALYDFFYARLWYQISQEGIGFYRELLHFKNIKRRLMDFCQNLSRTRRSQVMHVTSSPWNDHFVVTSQHCHLMVKAETTYFADLYRKQFPGNFSD